MEASHVLHSGYFNDTLRSWHGSNSLLNITQLIYPVFVTDLIPDESSEEIPNFPDQRRYGVDALIEHLSPLVNKGLRTILLFGVTTSSNKSPTGEYASSKESPVRRCIPQLCAKFPSLTIAVDLCLCGYTSHGHCGILKTNGTIDNQASIERIAEIALNLAQDGAHIIAPSDMMDGRIGAIKNILLTNNLASSVAVLSYSSKFASCFYGPFRDAAQSAPSSGNRRAYQLPAASTGLAIRAAERDVSEGADMLMVKPGGPFLDIIKEVKQHFPHHPLAVYQVSGEYAMLWHAARANAFELRAAVIESLMGMRRAGADILITYFTPQLLDWLKEEQQH
jgi:porphobilinogen synthase